MKRSSPRISIRHVSGVGIALLLILAVGVFAAACGGGSTATTVTTVAPGTSTTTVGGGTSSTTVGQDTSTTVVGTDTTAGGGATVQVIMKNRAYEPATVTINVGDTVTWTNQDSMQHDADADNGEFMSDLFDNGGTFSFTFTGAGTFPYHCSIHPGMVGTVVVQ